MFGHQRGLIYCAIAVLGLVTYSVFAETDGVIPETPAMIKKIKAWEACNKRVTIREDQLVEKSGGFPGNGTAPEVFTECGYKPGSQLIKELIEIIDGECEQVSSIDEISHAGSRRFYDYGDDSTIWKLANERCARVYAAHAGERAQEEEQARQEQLKKEEAERQAKALQRAKPFSIERTYQRTEDYVGVIIRTDRTRPVKCALLNADDEYLRVDTAIMTPPVDEMIIHSDGVNWTSVRCWAGN